MKEEKNIQEYLDQVNKGFLSQMPRILKEIQIYEDKLKTNSLTVNPKPAPQFNAST